MTYGERSRFYLRDPDPGKVAAHRAVTLDCSVFVTFTDAFGPTDDQSTRDPGASGHVRTLLLDPALYFFKTLPELCILVMIGCSLVWLENIATKLFCSLLQRTLLKFVQSLNA